MKPFEARLATVLTREISGCRSLTTCERLSGGANQETYRILIDSDRGERQLCLRRAAGGATEHAVGLPGLAVEAQLFREAARVGVPEPEVHYVLQPKDDLGQGFIMQWLTGETLGVRIARADAFEHVRPMLARQCGELLARIHRIPLGSTGLRTALAERDAESVVRLSWELYQSYGTPQPMIDYAARWLLEHLPQPTAPRLVHGDFRNGNLMIDPQRGIIGVLDWEGAHIGDPMRDLGWVCTNSWRFGVSEKPVGGFGEFEDLIDGYAAQSRQPVDTERVRFWIVYGSYNWAIGCLTMAQHYRTGPDATVERPGIGRRTSECQIDCANLLFPGRVDLPEPTGQSLDRDMPRADELLTSVRDFLRGDVMSSSSGRTQFLARVAANSLDILVRDAARGELYRAGEVARLERLLDMQDGYHALRQTLCERLRRGTIDLESAVLKDYLRYATLTQALIDQPGYSGVKTALANRETR